jgi:hypothetical protein
VYLGGSVRAGFEVSKRTDEVELRLDTLKYPPVERDVAERAVELAACTGGALGCPPALGHVGHCDIDALTAALVAYTDQKNPFDLRSALEGRGACHLEIDRDTTSKRIFALAARLHEVHLVPLGGLSATRPGPTLTELPRVRRAVAAGIGRIRVVGAP